MINIAEIRRLIDCRGIFEASTHPYWFWLGCERLGTFPLYMPSRLLQLCHFKETEPFIVIIRKEILRLNMVYAFLRI